MKITELINKAIDYIMQHICEEISIEDVANYCNYSKYHFSRIFKEETGESIYAFIKRIKMDRSAFRLKVDTNKSITTIGEEYGYSASNYSTAFKQYHKTSPVQFRRNIVKDLKYNPFYKENGKNKEIKLNDFETCNNNITIESKDEFTIIYERYIDTYFNLASRWEYFLERYEHYITDESTFVEQTYDDPSITDINCCLYDLGIIIKENCDLKNTKKIQGGKYAIYHFKGYTWQIYPTYQSIFNIWIPQSQYVIDNRSGFDIYRFIDCEKMYAEIDIHIPVI